MTMTRKIGGKKRAFDLLTQDDLRSIMATVPNLTGDIIDIRSLDRWSKNLDGCEVFIFYAAKKSDPTLTRAMVHTWGSIMGRVNLASELFTASITSGEEEPDPKAEGVLSPPNQSTGS